MRKLLVLVLLVPFLAACGESGTKLSDSDEAAIAQFGKTVGEFRTVSNTVWEQTAQGSTIASPQEYVEKVGPKIERLDELATDLRSTVAGIENAELQALEQPLTDAISNHAQAMAGVLAAVKAKDNEAVAETYEKAQKTGARMHEVAGAQLPKVEAFGKTLE